MLHVSLSICQFRDATANICICKTLRFALSFVKESLFTRSRGRITKREFGTKISLECRALVQIPSRARGDSDGKVNVFIAIEPALSVSPDRQTANKCSCLPV